MFDLARSACGTSGLYAQNNNFSDSVSGHVSHKYMKAGCGQLLGFLVIP